jgi:tetratricopeptide (TPR) repeat protein
MRHGRFWSGLALAVFFGWALSSAQPPAKSPAPPTPDKDEEPSPEEQKEKLIAERFRKVLEGNPRRGTALDRLYGYHVERGTLDKLIKEYQDRTTGNPKDGASWMIIGLLESQRGKDAAAVAAFRQAEANLTDNPIPGYYLGQSLVLVGQPEAAAEAYERALTRKPNRNDLLDIFQALGRVYQRAQRPEKALDVWSRLEKLFPDDARVQEQIATTLVEEGQFDQALPRLIKLAAATEDKYRQTSFRIDAAELKVKLKKTADALADFEKVLAELDPDSWLYRDVRRRVEDVFLRGDDLAGLAKYYEKWLEKNPTDVDAIARLAKNLSSQGRAPEARSWLEKGLAVAPTNRQLRQGLIDQLVFEQNFAAAAQQYEAVDKNDPNNPDTLREWGRMLMRDSGKPEAERRSAAAAVWKRLLDKKPTDPVVTSQVADLMRSAGATDEAIALYKKAIQLAPDAAQYREYLGEYYHTLMRSEEAIATWRPIAEGANRNAKNLARLAEVFAGFGYRKQAIDAMADAISLEKDDFTLLMTYAELLHQDEQHAKALEQIALASTRTSNPEEVEQILLAQIKVYQATDKLADEILSLEKELNEGKSATADRWLRLARFFEANRQADKASEAIARASEKDPKSLPVLIAAARIFEAAGNLLAASDSNRKLAALDRRFRSDYLTAVAKLEQRLGRREQALQAGRDLLAASPGNPEVYKFYADLCFQLGEQEEGLEALRRSVRANPSDPQGLIVLANALSERIRQGEAIELLWRAFEKTNELEGKLGIIERITQLYLENNQFDRLIERLERERREADKAREMTMCLAQSFTTAGDLGTARGQLERLLTENNRDVNLLSQLVSLCETEGDVASALKYQRQITAAAPNNYDHQLKLAQLLTRSGEADAAADIWVKLVAGETEPHRNLTSIDQLLTNGKFEAALAILVRLEAQKPGNWELLYRDGAALIAKGQLKEGVAKFQAILAMKMSDDELGEITKYQIKQAKKKAAKPGQQQVYNPYSRSDDVNRPPLLRRTANVWNIRGAVGMDARGYYRGGGNPQFYVPGDYGEARMACLGFLFEAARAQGKADEFARQLRIAKDKAGADPRPMWDWYYFQALRNEKKDVLSTALTLSKGSDPAGLLAYLISVQSRENSSNNSRRGRNPNDKDKTPPLPQDQLAHALDCYRKLKQMKPDWVTDDVTQTVLTELKRAKRVDEETAIYKDFLKNATTVEKVTGALNLAVERSDVDGAVELFTRMDRLQAPAKTASGRSQLATRQVWRDLLELMGKRADSKQYADILRVLDLYLDTTRKQNMATAGSVSTMRRQQAAGLAVQTYSKLMSNRNQTQLTYPSPNEYYDEGAITLLYNAYDLLKKADLLSDLTGHFRDNLAKAKGPERLYHLLAIGYIHWWAEEKEEAIAAISEAMQSAPGNHNLLLEAASLREENREPEVALALLDSITPLDTQMMQRREDAALRLAERTGNVERARQAAERLFGLRLDPDKQLELAGKMHRLGMSQLAETVLNRAQRQAGNKTNMLLKLMSQYQSQNQDDLAVQIARQILRKAPTPNFTMRGWDESDGSRDQAVRVLARSGQLKEMIERAEAQLKTSPKSIQIHQSLIGYYQAAGDKEKLKTTLINMAAIKPEDGKLRYQVASQLEQAGEREAAIEQYTIAIKLDPSVLMYRYWQVQNLFGQANKMEDLAKLLDEVDLRKVGYYWAVAEVINSLLTNDKGRELGLKLFRKTWEAFPQYRSQLLSQLYDDSIWRLPEIYAYTRQAVIPREDSEIEPWEMATDIVNWGGGNEGRMDAVVTRMLTIARKQQRLPELRAEVTEALAKRPDWTGGKALLAAIEIQSGNKESGKKLWQELFGDPKLDVPPLARFIMTQELEFYGGLEELALKTLEDGVEDMMKESQFDFNQNPARRLIWWYEQMGRKEDARKLLLKFANIEQSDPGYGGNYWYYRIVESKIGIAQDLQRLGETIEAVRLYNQLLADKETLSLANQVFGGNEQFTTQIEQGLQAALKSLRPEILPSAVGKLLTPRELTAGNRSVLDLVVLFESRDLAKARLNSVFAAAIKSTEKAPEIRRDALMKLADLAKKHPNDFSVLSAAALAAFAEGKPEGIREAVDRLTAALEATPLEPVPPNKKPNARQRAEAQAQVVLWLVARECLGKEKDRAPYRDAGETLARRAVLAAKRLDDTLVATSILREWGQLELDRGDKAKAEAHWAEILEWLKPKARPAQGAGAAAVPANPGPVAPVPLTPAVPVNPKPPLSQALPSNANTVAISTPLAPQVAPPAVVAAPTPATAAKGNAASLTVEQFQNVYALAMLAAEKGIPALSLKTMKEAIRGGPLAPGKVNPNRGGGGLRGTTINGVMYYVANDGQENQVGIDRALVELIPRWRSLNVPAAEIYDLVVSAVLPDNRPAEVFIYAETRLYGTIYSISPGGYLTPAEGIGEIAGDDRGLCVLLCDLAIESGKVEHLRAKALSRVGQPLGELPAQVLLATLAMQAKDDARALEQIRALGARVQKESLQGTNDRAISVFTPALANPKYADAVIPFIEKTAANYLAGNNLAKASELRFKLAQHYLAKKDEAAARAQFKVVEGFGKKINRHEFDVRQPLAVEYLKAGWVEDALREFAEHADNLNTDNLNPQAKEKREEPTLGELPQLVRHLLAMPAARRYEVLKAWSLPTGDRKWIRYFVGLMPKQVPLPQFITLPPLPLNQPVSTMTLLIEAARECGKIEELAAAAEKLAADKVESADLFQLLLKLSLGKGKEAEAAVVAFTDSAYKRMTEKKERGISNRYYNPDDDNRLPTQVHVSELLVAGACLADPALSAHGEKLLEPMQRCAQTTNRVDCLERILDLRQRLAERRVNATKALEGGLPARWQAGPTGQWFAQDGYLTEARSSNEAFVLLDTPLAGTFEFSVEMSAGCNLGYGGIVFDPHGQSAVRTFGQNDMVSKSPVGLRGEMFNRFTIQVSPGKVRGLINGILYYEDKDAPATSPWLMLGSGLGGQPGLGGPQPVFRNVTLTGKPEVVTDVKLSDGDSLSGWQASLYGGTLPARLALKEEQEGMIYDRWGNPIQRDPYLTIKYEWQAKNGEILGQKVDQPTAKPVPSLLAYFRPLQKGETIRYEFFHEAGKTHVHPCIGQVAFLLEPDGVVLHWMTGADDWTGVAADNRVEDPAVRRGGKPPLKSGEWNAIAITNAAGSVKIDLNGAAICEMPLPADAPRTFGLFHDRGRTAARVRNVVLTGSWSKEANSLVNFATAPKSGAEAVVRRSQLGEKFYATEIRDLISSTRKLPPAERYSKLAAWVLPSEKRPIFVLEGIDSPRDALGVVDQKDQPKGQRVMLGGRFEAPCLELIEAARAANTLDELAERIARADSPVADDLFRRSRAALLAAARAAQGRDAEAAEGLKALLEFVKKMPPDLPSDERWPDLIAAYDCLERPALHKSLEELANAMNARLEEAMIQKKEFEQREWWMRASRTIRSHLQVAGLPDGVRRDFGSDPGLAYWASVPLTNAAARSQGWSTPHWTYSNGVVTHYPGHNHDYLLLRTPLRGDFEVACELKLEGWQEAHIRYGSYQFDLSYDRKKYTLHNDVRNSSSETTISPPLPENKSKVYKFRLVVKDGWFRAFVDDREVASEKIGANPDPWLMLHCPHLNTGELRNLTLNGKPTVPVSIDLLADDGLGMWQPYTGQVVSGSSRMMGTTGWQKRGEEIHEPGQKPEPPPDGKPIPPREFPESAIFYQRPLLENGTVEYDFFYNPDKSLVHPALDRLVFLLEPDGVKLHWLTDGVADRSGVAIDNATVEPKCRRGPDKLPLKEKAWNHVRLTVAGDVVKLALNGTEIYERAIEPTNQRFFGLFHYTDRTEVRARSFSFTGDWPRTLPANEKLFEKK